MQPKSVASAVMACSTFAITLLQIGVLRVLHATIDQLGFDLASFA